MDLADVRRLRLANQLITAPMMQGGAVDVVSHMGAMQAQEYAMAKWAVGLRLVGATEPAIEAAFQAGRILRTHVLRPTWHFVAPQDIRWLLRLTGPHVKRRLAKNGNELGLNEQVLARCFDVFERELGDGTELTRSQLAEKLAQAGIQAAGRKMAYILIHAELEGVICSGARTGKQFTYALLDLKAPADRLLGPSGVKKGKSSAIDPFEREAALAELAARYFASRGPATVHDFSYWSGLPMADARTGVRLLDQSFVQEPVDGVAHWYRPTPGDAKAACSMCATFLMPDFDEYVMGYRDRSAIMPAADAAAMAGQPSFVAFGDSALGSFDLNTFKHWLVLDGRIQATWQYTNARKTDVAVRLLRAEDSRHAALEDAISRFRAFAWPASSVAGETQNGSAPNS